MKRPYYTYLGADWIGTLRAWRGRWVEQLGREPEADDLVLLGKGNQPVDVGWLRNCLKRTVRQLSSAGMLQNRDLRSWHHHTFRKAFRTACSHAKVKSDFSEFWLGHDMGVKAVYDRADEVHEADFRAEYEKVEPYVSPTPRRDNDPRGVRKHGQADAPDHHRTSEEGRPARSPIRLLSRSSSPWISRSSEPLHLDVLLSIVSHRAPTSASQAASRASATTSGPAAASPSRTGSRCVSLSPAFFARTSPDRNRRDRRESPPRR